MNNNTNIKTISIAKQIYNKEGFRGFYRGFLWSSQLGTVSQFIFFYQLELFNIIVNNKLSNYSISKQISTTYLAGISSSLITLPLWTLRVRVSQLSFNKTENVFQGLRLNLILLKETFTSKKHFFTLYKGLYPTFFLSLTPTIQLTLYQTIKNSFDPETFKTKISHYAGSFSSFVTSIIFFPFSYIKSKQQQLNKVDNVELNKNLYENNFNEKKYSSVRSAIRTIYSEFGIIGFFRGYSPIFIRSVLRGGLFFHVYEYFNSKLS